MLRLKTSEETEADSEEGEASSLMKLLKTADDSTEAMSETEQDTIR